VTDRSAVRLACVVRSADSARNPTQLPPDSGSAFTLGPTRAELIQDAPAGPWQDHYRKLLDDLPDLDAYQSALIHTDLAPNNVLLKPEGELVLVDFDDLGLGPRVFDLGYPLLCWFHERGTFDQASALAFYSAYAVRHRLDERERSAIVDAAIFYALMYDGGRHDTRRLRHASNAAGTGRPDLERLLSLAWAAGPARRMA
jgi:Ser/Thr protein kinase RdoA (MazF antagonist)